MYTVLIADDERWVRASLKKIIERTELPFQVEYEASHGLEVLDFVKNHHVDVIITDIRMPIMDGLQLVCSLQQQGSKIDTIIVSGHDEFQYAQQAVKLGVRDYLLKPVMIEDMYECLTKLIDDLSYKQQQEELKSKSDNGLATIPVEERSTIEQVLAFIHKKMPGEVTLQETAAAVHLNPSYLSSLFKEQKQMKFMDYVMQLRMEEAKKLLVTTSLRISEIADRLGYNDIAYFSNTFKRICGETPSQYRKSSKA
ncbi:response regulator transcription factor [Halalkalibacter urbisdiaboli]|uniref:response regulator transcription factor n=1 Tax=Halalkalibacter urbisdiaboli TaxID=1960589 RepID=UPI000B436610|nr:response regulator [Halalkalibacter urbisdiaboli]